MQNIFLQTDFLELDALLQFSCSDGSRSKNVVTFGVDMSSSVHVGNKSKDISVLGEGPTQDLHDTTITTEAKYPINFTQSGKKVMLSQHCIGNNSFLSVNAVKCIDLKQKILK